jgi:hypothetical protein
MSPLTKQENRGETQRFLREPEPYYGFAASLSPSRFGPVTARRRRPARSKRGR